MKKYLLCLTLIFIGTFISNVHSQTTASEADCGKWVKAEPEMKRHLRFWITSYLSGMNHVLFSIRNKDFLAKISSTDQITVFIDNYCQKNPLDSLSLAGVVLMAELDKK